MEGGPEGGGGQVIANKFISLFMGFGTPPTN